MKKILFLTYFAALSFTLNIFSSTANNHKELSKTQQLASHAKSKATRNAFKRADKTNQEAATSASASQDQITASYLMPWHVNNMAQDHQSSVNGAIGTTRSLIIKTKLGKNYLVYFDDDMPHDLRTRIENSGLLSKLAEKNHKPFCDSAELRAQIDKLDDEFGITSISLHLPNDVDGFFIDKGSATEATSRERIANRSKKFNKIHYYLIFLSKQMHESSQ